MVKARYIASVKCKEFGKRAGHSLAGGPRAWLGHNCTIKVGGTKRRAKAINFYGRAHFPGAKRK